MLTTQYFVVLLWVVSASFFLLFLVLYLHPFIFIFFLLVFPVQCADNAFHINLQLIRALPWKAPMAIWIILFYGAARDCGSRRLKETCKTQSVYLKRALHQDGPAEKSCIFFIREQKTRCLEHFGFMCHQGYEWSLVLKTGIFPVNVIHVILLMDVAVREKNVQRHVKDVSHL